MYVTQYPDFHSITQINDCLIPHTPARILKKIKKRSSLFIVQELGGAFGWGSAEFWFGRIRTVLKWSNLRFTFGEENFLHTRKKLPYSCLQHFEIV